MNCTLSSLASSPWLSCVIFLLLCICFKDYKQLQLIKVQTHFSSQFHLLHIISRKTYVKKIKYMYPFCRKQIDVTGYTHVSQLKLSIKEWEMKRLKVVGIPTHHFWVIIFYVLGYFSMDTSTVRMDLKPCSNM